MILANLFLLRFTIMTLELRQSSPTCVKLPALPLIKGAKGIYTGKYNDNYPSVQSVSIIYILYINTCMIVV